MRTLLVLGFALATFIAGHAAAEGVYLDYSASEDCPARDEFERQVHARTPRVRFVEPSNASRFFQIVVGHRDGMVVGRLSNGRGEDVGSARELASQSCDEVVAAVALIVALAIDPNASVGQLEPRAVAQQESRPQSALPEAEMPPTLPSTGTPPTANSERPSVVTPPQYAPAPYLMPRPLEHASSGSPAIEMAFGLRAGTEAWLTSPGVPLGVLTALLSFENSSASPYAAAVQVSASYTRSTSVHEAGASAIFDIWSAGLEYCPLRWAVSNGLVLRPCGGIECGRLTGTGLAGGVVNDVWVRHAAWGALIESMRFQIRLAGGWQSVLEAGLSEPLERYRFIFEGDPPVQVVRVPVLVPRLSIGIVRRFL